MDREYRRPRSRQVQLDISCDLPGSVRALVSGCEIMDYVATPRGRGVGSEAYQIVEDYLRDNSCDKIMLLRVSKKSIPFWKRLGYSKLQEGEWGKHLVTK